MGPTGFSWSERKNGDVVIARDGQTVVSLRGKAARRFVADIEHRDPQEVMARATGNYKRGNERDAARHPRNQRRR